MSTATNSTAAAKRRGRPSNAAAGGGDAREAILRAASELFREKGYEGVSMTAIAREVGLDQSSLYYWFKSKGQLLDEVLIADFNACQFKGRLFHASSAPCAVRLFALVYRRTAKLCRLPVDLFNAEAVADANPGLLEHFFSEFESYKANLLTLLAEGLERGELSGPDAQGALCVAISVIVSQQHLFHRVCSGAGLAEGASLGAEPRDEAAWALRAARVVLSALLSDPAQLDQAEKAARDRGWLELDPSGGEGAAAHA